MSNTRAIIDYAMDDNGKELRSALYADIHDRVLAHIEQKKIELSGGIMHNEEKECDYDDMKSKMKKTKKKMKKLKEEIAILEEYLELTLLEGSSCDDMDADDVKDEIENKKKKLKKKEKKMNKLKESFALLESEGVDEDGDWEESEEEEDEESEE